MCGCQRRHIWRKYSLESALNHARREDYGDVEARGPVHLTEGGNYGGVKSTAGAFEEAERWHFKFNNLEFGALSLKNSQSSF